MRKKRADGGGILRDILVDAIIILTKGFSEEKVL